jgi:hypothetical protein
MSIFTSCARYRKYLYRKIDLFIFFFGINTHTCISRDRNGTVRHSIGEKKLSRCTFAKDTIVRYFFLYVSTIEYNRQNIWRSAVLKLDYTRLLFISLFLSSHLLDRTCQTIVLFYCHNCMMNVRRCICLFITHNTREKHVLEFFCICFSIGNIYIYIYCFFFRLTEVFSY